MYTSFFKRQRQYDTFKRKKISIKRYCHNKRARYACIPRSLSVSDNMPTRAFKAKEIINREILPQQTASQICMYTSFFNRQRQYDTFKAREIVNREILPQQMASQICMYTSFFKRQRQYDTLKRKKISIKRYCHNKRARYACIPRSLSVSDNMTR